MTDRELLELAAKAAGFTTRHPWNAQRLEYEPPVVSIVAYRDGQLVSTAWNPLTNDGDRYRLARSVGISIDFEDCYAWKRLSNHRLIQEYWGDEHGDEAHAIVRAAAEIGRAMP